MYCEAAGQLPLSVCVEATRATLPALALMATFPVTSGVGKSWPHGAASAQPAPEAPLTKRYWPGKSVTCGNPTLCHAEPVAEEYWTDQPERSTAVSPRLKISMKS